VILLVARRMTPGDHFTAQQEDPSFIVPPARALVVRRESTFSADATSISVSSERFISPTGRTTVPDGSIDREKGIAI
jgi:hypothetical protein